MDREHAKPLRARRSAIPPQQTAIYVAGVPAAIAPNCSDLNKFPLLPCALDGESGPAASLLSS